MFLTFIPLRENQNRQQIPCVEMSSKYKWKNIKSKGLNKIKSKSATQLFIKSKIYFSSPNVL